MSDPLSQPRPSVPLWDAINEYAEACGGDTGSRTVGGRRMDAVVAVERAFNLALAAAREEGEEKVCRTDLAEANRLLAEQAADLAAARERNETLVHTLKMIAIVDQGAGGNLSYEEMAKSAMQQARAALPAEEDRRDGRLWPTPP